MYLLTKYLLLILCVMLTSCGALHPIAASVDVADTLSVVEQRRYEYYFLEAECLEQQGRYDEAFEMLNHCLAICPTAPSALYKMSNYYMVLNQKDKALDVLEQAVEATPTNYWYKQTLASYYQNSGEYDKAIALLEEMQERFPKRNGELLTALVGLYNHTGQYDKVISALGRLEGLIGKSEAISMEKSRNYLLMGNQEGAFNEIEKLAAEYPDNPNYRVILAEVYMQHGRMTDVEPLLQNVLAEDPDNGSAKISLAQYYKQQNDTAQYYSMIDSVMLSANIDDDTKIRLMTQLIMEKTDSVLVLELFERAIAQPQRSAKLGHLCVQYMLSLQQSEEQIRPVLLRMLEVEPDHIQARLQLLAYAARRNSKEEIIDICTTAIDYTPEVLDFYYYKAIVLHQTGEVREALETYRKATAQITQASDTELIADIYAAMGDLHHELGMTDEAYLCYDTALVYNPNDILVLNNYAYFLSEEERELEKAEQMSLRTIKAAPDNATYLDTYAWILYKKGEYAAAFQYIEQAIAADSMPSSVLYEHAGDICYQMGNTERAIAYWEQALKLQRKAEAVDEKLIKKIKQKRL